MNKFQKIIKASKLSNYQLSKMTGISQSHIGRLERGISEVDSLTIKNAKKLAKALGVNLLDIIE